MRLTREQAIELCGIVAVERVEASNYEPTGREIYPDEATGREEWMAATECEGGCLKAYILHDEDEVAKCADLQDLDWTPQWYELD